MEGKRIELNTKGCCFFCLHQLPRNNCGGGGIKRGTASKLVERLCRYLQIQLDKTTDASIKRLLIGEATLCESCYKNVDKFLEYHLEMEKIQMKMDFHLKRLNGKIEEAANDEELVGNYSRRMTGDPKTVMLLATVDNLRKEISKKCSKFQFSSLQPIIQVGRGGLNTFKRKEPSSTSRTGNYEPREPDLAPCDNLVTSEIKRDDVNVPAAELENTLIRNQPKMTGRRGYKRRRILSAGIAKNTRAARAAATVTAVESNEMVKISAVTSIDVATHPFTPLTLSSAQDTITVSKEAAVPNPRKDRSPSATGDSEAKTGSQSTEAPSLSSSAALEDDGGSKDEEEPASSSKGGDVDDKPMKTKKKRNPIIIPDHITVSEGNPPMYRCNLCEKQFRTKGHIKYHVFCGNRDKPFKCGTCGQEFIVKSHYEYHLRTHTGERPYVCLSCGKGFNQKSKVTRHMRTHTGEKPFVCPQCNRGFASAQALRCHTLIHTGERPFACSYCEKRFTAKTNLKKHEIIHTGQRFFNCTYCEKSFGTKTTLQSHLRTHSTERPHACDQCPRAFSSKKDLLRHLVNHSGEKPFKCWICGTAFRRKDNLDRHIKNAHKQSKEIAKQLSNEAATDYLKNTAKDQNLGNIPVSKVNSIVISNVIKNNQLMPASGLVAKKSGQVATTASASSSEMSSAATTVSKKSSPSSSEGTTRKMLPKKVTITAPLSPPTTRGLKAKQTDEKEAKKSKELITAGESGCASTEKRRNRKRVRFVKERTTNVPPKRNSLVNSVPPVVEESPEVITKGKKKQLKEKGSGKSKTKNKNVQQRNDGIPSAPQVISMEELPSETPSTCSSLPVTSTLNMGDRMNLDVERTPTLILVTPLSPNAVSPEGVIVMPPGNGSTSKDNKNKLTREKDSKKGESECQRVEYLLPHDIDQPDEEGIEDGNEGEQHDCQISLPPVSSEDEGKRSAQAAAEVEVAGQDLLADGEPVLASAHPAVDHASDNSGRRESADSSPMVNYPLPQIFDEHERVVWQRSFEGEEESDDEEGSDDESLNMELTYSEEPSDTNTMEESESI